MHGGKWRWYPLAKHRCCCNKISNVTYPTFTIQSHAVLKSNSSQLLLGITILRGQYEYYPHFTDEKHRIRKGTQLAQGPTAKWKSRDWNPGPPDSRICVVCPCSLPPPPTPSPLTLAPSRKAQHCFGKQSKGGKLSYLAVANATFHLGLRHQCSLECP